MAELVTADLIREVEETRGVANSVITFIGGFRSQLKDLQDQLAAVSQPQDPGTEPTTPEVDANAEAQRVIAEAVAQLDQVQADIVAAIQANDVPAEGPAPEPDVPAEEPSEVPEVPAEVPEAPEAEVPEEIPSEEQPPAEEDDGQPVQDGMI